MDAIVIVEVLDRRGRVSARQAIAALPATIGRDFGCAVVLDDRWASPIHARIVRDAAGRVVVEDAGSENGLFPAGGRTRVASLDVGNGTAVRIGRTTIRIVDPTAPLPPTLRYGARLPGLEGWLEEPRVAFFLALAAGLLAAWQGWATHVETGPASTMASAFLGVAVALGAWAGIWAFFGRGSVIGGRFNGHLSVAAATVVALLLLGAAHDYAEFLWPERRSARWVITLLEGATLVALFAGHLFLNTRLRRLRLLTASIGVAAALTGVVAVAGDWSVGTDAGFSSTLKPVNASLIPTRDPDQFFRGLPALKAAVDSLAADST